MLDLRGAIVVLGAAPNQVAHGHAPVSLVTSMFAHANLYKVFINLMLLWAWL